MTLRKLATRRNVALSVSLFSILVSLTLVAHAANPDALWNIVHDRCLPNMFAQGNPAPCAAVDLQGGTVLLKDRVGVAQFLLMPTARITGIESPAILSAGAPNYFAAAWAARTRVSALLAHPLPRDATSLAINSESGRTQNQLHIHVDCLRADIRATLATRAAAISDSWAPLPGGLAGHPYLAMRLSGDTISANPFRLLANLVPDADTDMGSYTLVLVGAPDGFILLADHADPVTGDRASGEELQDHSCHGY
jgi:CDP-diacylglycerol pyrophosphatase